MPSRGPTRPLPITEPDRLRAALERQDERERLVIELRYGLEDGHQRSLSEIATLLGVSRGRVRQIESSALEQLRWQASGAPARRAGSRRARARRVMNSAGPARQRFLRPWTLMLLWLRPAHGSYLRESLGELGMPEPDYRFLRRLETDGLLRSTWVSGGGVGADRRVYSLTTKGTEQLQRDAEALAKVADALRSFLELWQRPVGGTSA